MKMSSEEFNKILAGIPNKELVEKIHNHLTDMCKNREVFTMTIPPDPYRDFDILLGELIRRFNKQSLPVEAQVNQATCGFCKDCKFWDDENVECTKDIVWVLSQNSYLKINDLKTQHYFGCTQFESKLSG